MATTEAQGREPWTPPPPPGLEARAFTGLHEWEAHTRLGMVAFQPELQGDAVDPLVRRWLALLAQGPELPTAIGRGAFAGSELAGGYVLWLRDMRLGATTARTACIGGVVVAPAWRKRGVGRLLMLDALAEAKRKRAALLLLDGIADFYRPFGYVDIWDATRHSVAAADVAALPRHDGLCVRPAAEADVAALASLYRRHFGDYTGSFERSRALAAHRVRTAALNGGGVQVALDGGGRVRGYLVLPRRDPSVVREAVAEDHAALAALLQAHAAAAAARSAEVPQELTWELPADSLTFGLLADLLPVRSETRRREHAGWQARPADPVALARVAARAVPDDGRRQALDLEIDGVPCQPKASAASGAPVPNAALSGPVWLALAFHHRPLAWAATQPGQAIPREAEAALASWLPAQPVWVPGSDRF
jgi:GNAT superfamily N-acetyltransferase